MLFQTGTLKTANMQLAARQEYLWEKSKRWEAVGFLPLCSSLFSYGISKKKKVNGEGESGKSVEDREWESNITAGDPSYNKNIQL